MEEFVAELSAAFLSADLGLTPAQVASVLRTGLAGSTTGTYRPDGSSATVTPDGGAAVAAPDGTVVGTAPDGSVGTYRPDGSSTTADPDGSVTTVTPVTRPRRRTGWLNSRPRRDPPSDGGRSGVMTLSP